MIRNHGLKYRIGDPRDFIRKMNPLVMQMTHTGKKNNASTRRKMILRRMKKLLKIVESHGQLYYDLLDNHRSESDLSYNQAQVILERMQNTLRQIPSAIDQAAKRIIQEEKVNNTDKILSLYDGDIYVLIRGKSGAQVEFGSGLYLAENEDGLITDWQFFQDQPPADSTLVAGSLERLKEHYGPIRSYTGDRGFYSADNSRLLEEEGIYNAICPKPVRELENRLCEGDFVRLQKRRAGTEARIGILKNNFIGKPLRNKKFGNRKRRIGWSILAHNLWVLASIAAENCREEQEPFQYVS